MEKQATFGAGCFWCIEPVFSPLKGVKRVYPGYSGGSIANPTYMEVCRKDTGHAEVLRIDYDDEIINFQKLLEIFWFVHDPTTLNRQGHDIGDQYRSVIFCHDSEQFEIAKKYKERLNKEEAFDAPVVTEIKMLEKFYPAEENHKDFYNENPEVPYCETIIRPKVERFKRAFSDLLR